MIELLLLRICVCVCVLYVRGGIGVMRDKKRIMGVDCVSLAATDFPVS